MLSIYTRYKNVYKTKHVQKLIFSHNMLSYFENFIKHNIIVYIH